MSAPLPVASGGGLTPASGPAARDHGCSHLTGGKRRLTGRKLMFFSLTVQNQGPLIQTHTLSSEPVASELQPRVKRSLWPVFVKKGLLEHDLARQFLYILWL